MFNNDAEEQEQQVNKYQWVVPFLGGLVAALFICAAVIAMYLLKMGPFAVSERQASIENAITGATDDIQRQADQAAFDEQAAADPSLAASQNISIGALQFGPASVQAIGELASAEARGLVKCDPALAGLDPTDRASLSKISCTLAPAPTAGTPPQPAQPLSSMSFTFANGRVASLNYVSGAAQGPAPAGDTLPTAPAEPAAPAQNPPGNEAPAAAGDAPPTN